MKSNVIDINDQLMLKRGRELANKVENMDDLERVVMIPYFQQYIEHINCQGLAEVLINKEKSGE